MIWPFISRGWWSDRNLQRSRIKWCTWDRWETLSHLLLTQSKGSLNRLSKHLVRGRESNVSWLKCCQPNEMVCWDRQKENRTLKASTDWLFQQSYAAQQRDNELSLIRGELLYIIICVCVCQHDEYSKKIVCGNIPEEQLACCYTHMGGSPRTSSQSYDCSKYQWSCRSWKDLIQVSQGHAAYTERETR